MRWHIALVGLSLAFVGCKNPFSVETNGQFGINGFVETSNEVIMGNRSPEEEPILAVPLGGVDCRAGDARVAIIDLDGVLLNSDYAGFGSAGENPVALFREKLDAVAADPSVCALVLRVNSLAGSVAATDMMHRELLVFKTRRPIPVVACVMDVGCGAGYHLACGADHIVAHPTSIVGGIGVILNLYNLVEALNFFNIRTQQIKAGEKTDIGTPLERISEENEAILQAMADEYHRRFQAVVRQSRPGLAGNTAEIFDGRVFTASQAQQRGLIDGIGYLEDAITSAAGMARAPDARPVMYRRAGEPARSIYSRIANTPLTLGLLPHLPGVNRSRMPTFMYAWQPEVAIEVADGK